MTATTNASVTIESVQYEAGLGSRTWSLTLSCDEAGHRALTDVELDSDPTSFAEWRHHGLPPSTQWWSERTRRTYEWQIAIPGHERPLLTRVIALTSNPEFVDRIRRYESGTP